MFVPVHDINPLKRLPFQWVTVSLIALNALGYLLFATDFFAPMNQYAVDFALVPVELLGRIPTPSSVVFQLHDPLPMPEQVTIITCMFVHLGGFAAGAVFILFMRRPGVPLFDRTATAA